MSYLRDIVYAMITRQRTAHFYCIIHDIQEVVSRPDTTFAFVHLSHVLFAVVGVLDTQVLEYMDCCFAIPLCVSAGDIEACGASICRCHASDTVRSKGCP